MKSFQVNFDETVVTFLEFVANSLNRTVEEVISDVVFNQVDRINQQINRNFCYTDEFEQKEKH